MLKKNIFSNTNFNRIFVDLASKNASKIDHFSNIFPKRRFCKNRAPVYAGAQFSRFGASQKRSKIDADIAFEKKPPKNIPKINFDIHFGFPKPPKIDAKSKKMASESELKKKLQPPSETGARPNAVDPASQTQETS